MPTIVGILTFMSRKNFMLNWVENEKSFITSGPDLGQRNTESSESNSTEMNKLNEIASFWAL